MVTLSIHYLHSTCLITFLNCFCYFYTHARTLWDFGLNLNSLYGKSHTTGKFFCVIFGKTLYPKFLPKRDRGVGVGWGGGGAPFLRSNIPRSALRGTLDFFTGPVKNFLHLYCCVEI
jgi:hypothetical protein